MKKALIIAAAALAMASCAKVNVDNTAKDKETLIDTPVTYEAYNYAGGTKAAGANELRFYLEGSFKVFSFYSATEWKDLADEIPANAKFINGDEVMWRAANDYVTSKAWRTEETYYWPKSGTLSFLAYYPSAVSSYATVAKKSEGVKFTDYAVLETVESQYANGRVKSGDVVDENGKFPGATDYTKTTGITDDINDILVADLQTDQTVNQNGTYYTKGVPMLFRHKLAKVKLQAKQAKKPENGKIVEGKFRIIINSISIDNIHLKGSYSSTSTANVWTLASDDVLVPVSNTTTAHKNSGNFAKNQTNNGNADGSLINNKLNFGTEAEPRYEWEFDDKYALPLFYVDETATPKVENNYWDLGNEYYVLPQNLEGLSDILVNYTVFSLDEKDGKSYIASSKTYDAKVQLNTITTINNNEDVAIETWKINGFYTYRLLISPYGEPILFDPAISDWDKVTSNPYTIYTE